MRSKAILTTALGFLSATYAFSQAPAPGQRQGPGVQAPQDARYQSLIRLRREVAAPLREVRQVGRRKARTVELLHRVPPERVRRLRERPLRHSKDRGNTRSQKFPA